MITKNGIEYQIENPPKQTGVRLTWCVSYETSDFESVIAVCGNKTKALKYVKQLKKSDVLDYRHFPYVTWHFKAEKTQSAFPGKRIIIVKG